MSNSSQPNDNKITAVLTRFASPILLSIVGTFMWRDISEMRTDLKLLLLQQSANKVKIEVMQNDIAMLKAITLQPTIKGAGEKETYKYFVSAQPAKKEDELTIN